MKDLIRILLMATIGLFLVGSCRGQEGVSPNGEFTYEYISPYEVKTRFDVIEVGQQEVQINDEGHLWVLYHDTPYFISEPFSMDEVYDEYGFIEYQGGVITKLMHISPGIIRYTNQLTGETLHSFRPSEITWNNTTIKL